MPHSHHSHSGQFCPGHARDSLDAIVQHAISLHMTVFALTEHMPRHDIDRYPDEGPEHDLTHQLANEEAYFKEALRMREKYRGQIEIPIGFESDWIRPESADLIRQSIDRYGFDFFMGSVHHVHTVPIDYNQEMYHEARRIAGGTDERLFGDYFDAQLGMLKSVRPPVVGHFDLIRLKSDDPNQNLQGLKGVWERVLRNLDFIAKYGGILEINSSAVRKGMDDPYPKREVCQAALEKGIRFCLSDDSHGIDHIAHSYDRVLQFVEQVGIQSLTSLKHGEPSDNVDKNGTTDERFPTLRFGQVDVGTLRQNKFSQSTKYA
ncbi:hypothetical protein H2200_008917 [Cladophialophora chaetospira]|uniref:Histidinol-phosphatase n=1 Tax=Cladophialophora chaetospira TaxID=386627 RepID=A0AA38X4Z3_9EURO|nr:hypothetical protein H2200_008917 [Cladophialophora chaetospira]